MKSKAAKIIYLILLYTAYFVFPIDYCAYGSEVKRIALLPFRINAQTDMSFYADGIFDMFTTRLTKEGRVQVLSRDQVEAAMQSVAPSGAVNEGAARRIGTRLNADFVLFGSLTVLGNNLSLDAKMVDVSGGKSTMTFFDQSQDPGAVINKINLIAADINAKVFGRTQVADTAGAPAPAILPQSTPKSERQTHPENILKEDGFITHEKTEGVASLDSMRGATRETQPQF